MPPQPRDHIMNIDDRPPRSSREARAAARAAKSGNSHYRRGPSPELDDYHFSGPDEPRSPSSDIALQDAILAQAQQQRVVPVGQLSRNPPGQRRPQGNGHPNNRGGVPPSPKNQPPSYSGPPMDDEHSQNGSGPGRYRRNAPPVGRRPSASDGPPSSSSAPDLHPNHAAASPPRGPGGMNGRAPQHLAPGSQRRPPSPGAGSIEGNGINRIQSPSVQKSVLQPLEQKMQEYDHLMQEAHNQMTQLDEEIRIMQERRAQAEDRFMEAKAKHDDYERQHQGVSRALRGEPEPRMPSPEPVQRMVRMESFEDERPMSVQSSHKGKGRSRIRLSLFKGN